MPVQVEARLKQLEISPPQPSEAVENYVPGVAVGKIPNCQGPLRLPVRRERQQRPTQSAEIAVGYVQGDAGEEAFGATIDGTHQEPSSMAAC